MSHLIARFLEPSTAVEKLAVNEMSCKSQIFTFLILFIDIKTAKQLISYRECLFIRQQSHISLGVTTDMYMGMKYLLHGI